uniref:ZP domain-containing protein n=1 Tax=Globodera pallida TaxID=36090 RepID=A0A183CA88_GLOPA
MGLMDDHFCGMINPDYCQASYSHLTSLYVTLKFDIAASLRYYYGHEEQVTLSIEQQVCCVPSGNCTAPNYWPSLRNRGRV